MNKEDMKKQGYDVIGLIDKRMGEVELTIEDGWKALKSRSSQFSSFDLTQKLKKRQGIVTEYETLSKRIRGKFA